MCARNSKETRNLLLPCVFIMTDKAKLVGEEVVYYESLKRALKTEVKGVVIMNHNKNLAVRA